MISSIITPVRWYSEYFEANRFSIDCDICNFELISDKTRLLPFQFMRPKSPYQITKWFLRKQCVNPKEALLNTNDSLFTLDTINWNRFNFDFIGGKIKTTSLISQLEMVSIFADTEYYGVKIVVNDLKVTGAFNINAISSFRTIASITSVGTYYFEFQANASDVDFSINSNFANVNDYITIEEIQIYKFEKFSAAIGDIDLPLNLINVINLDNVNDVINYCGLNLPFQLPCGHYYMIMSSDDGASYYSEVLSIKDFIPSQSPYTILEWKNSCDLSDVIFQKIGMVNNQGGCGYFNRMYINQEVSNPEYPFKEESVEDGNFKLNVTFQKWEKNINLMVAKAPEFIVDALTAIRLHNNITITKSLRKKQIKVLSAVEVDSIAYEATPVFNECATNVNLKIVLKDKIIDSTCCLNKTLAPCYACTINLGGMDVQPGNVGGYYFGTVGQQFGLFTLNAGKDPTYTQVSSVGQVICLPNELPWINLNEEFWCQVPSFGAKADLPTYYSLQGYVFPDSFVTVKVTVYDSSSGSSILVATYNLLTVYTAAQFLAGINIMKSLILIGIPPIGSVHLSVKSFALNCDYGYSTKTIFIYNG